MKMFCKIENGMISDGSCKAVTETCPDCISGFYSLELDGILSQVFCHITTEGVTKPRCHDIKKQCITCETDFYNTEMPGEEIVKVFCKIDQGSAVDGSCKAIKEHCPDCQSGFYRFHILGNIYEAFCDMLVEGGEEIVKNIDFLGGFILVNFSFFYAKLKTRFENPSGIECLKK